MLDGPDLRGLRLHGRELAQRIYVAVRDEGWGTVPGVIEDLQVEQEADSFLVEFTSRHRQGAIDFEWRARFSGDAEGTISCSMDGVAHSAFRYAKIGFNVHHPLLESVGRRFRAATPDGPLEGRIERQIEPQRVVDGTLTAMFAPYSELALEYGAGQEVVFSFAGDLFELQDHRNWSDGNFKSYGTPLSVPWPMDAEPGQRIRQRVMLRPEGVIGAGWGEQARSRSVWAARPAGSCRRSGSSGRPAIRSTSARPRSSGWRTHDTFASPCGCTRRAGRTSSLPAWPDCARLGAELELAVSLEPGDDRQLERARVRARRRGRRRRARARARAPGRLHAGRAGDRARLARPGSCRARSRRGRRALRGRQRPVLLGRQPQAARDRRPRRSLLRALSRRCTRPMTRR